MPGRRRCRWTSTGWSSGATKVATDDRLELLVWTRSGGATVLASAERSLASPAAMARNWPTGPEPSARWRTSWTFWRRLAWYPVKLPATSASWVMTSTVSTATQASAAEHGQGNGQRQRQQAAQPGHDRVENECEQNSDRRRD